jgi:hypothetical protein
MAWQNRFLWSQSTWHSQSVALTPNLIKKPIANDDLRAEFRRKYGEDIICDDVSAEAAESQAANVLLGNPPGVVLVDAGGTRHLQPSSCRDLLVPKAGGCDAAAEEGIGKESNHASTEHMAVEPTTPVDDDVPAGEEAGICSGATGEVTKSSEETPLDPELLQESDVPARKEENAAPKLLQESDVPARKEENAAPKLLQESDVPARNEENAAPKLLQESDVPARKEEDAAARDDEPPATASLKEMVAVQKKPRDLFAKYGVRCMPKN